MRLTPLLIIVSLVISAGLSFIPSQAQAIDPLPDELVSTSGTHFFVNSSNIRFEGINDQTVFYIQFYWLVDGWSQYQYSNHLFDNVTGEYEGDTLTHLYSDNYTDFWYQYFWLCQDLGLNMVRLGVFDYSPWLKAMDAYYNHNSAWDAVWDPMVAMANLTGVYIDFCLCGGTEALDVTSPTYDTYEQWCIDLMTEYAGEKAIALWDCYNEAWSSGHAAWWNSGHGGYPGYLNWRTTVSAMAQTNAGAHLVTCDAWGNESKPFGEDGFNDPLQADTFDTCDGHTYGSVTDNIPNFVAWSLPFNRPIIYGEVAINDKGGGYVPPYWWYWPELEALAVFYNISTIWMTLYDYTGYPVDCSHIPDVPYPEAPPIPDPPAPPSPTITISAISSNVSSIYINMTVQFSVTLTGTAPDTSIIWTFDDGRFSMAEDPIHNWSSAGTYHVSLLVNGTAAPNTLTITILPVSSPAPPTPTPSPSLGDSLSILGYLLPGVVILVVLSLLVGAFRPGG